LHLPVQSGADSVLARMRRGYTIREYLERIHRLRDRCPGVALSTDIIVGFPGETDAEFEQTLELLRSLEYDEIFSFMYSPRPSTVSAKIYEDDISTEVKKARLREVQTLQQTISLAKNRQRVGEFDEILIDGPAKLKNDQVMGRTRTNRIVNVAAPENLVGQLIAVRITSATANSLLGEVWLDKPNSNSQLEGNTA
jgi:tRNA-2-methylthio-N6-dimethylallyladenosine synthase